MRGQTSGTPGTSRGSSTTRSRGAGSLLHVVHVAMIGRCARAYILGDTATSGGDAGEEGKDRRRAGSGAAGRHGARRPGVGEAAGWAQAQSGPHGRRGGAGTGSAKLKLKPEKKQICYELTVSCIEPATAAHIYEGRAGKTGDVVVEL